MPSDNFIKDYMNTYFDEVEPKDFYRAIFPPGELATHEEKETKGKVNKWNLIKLKYFAQKRNHQKNEKAMFQ